MQMSLQLAFNYGSAMLKDDLGEVALKAKKYGGF